MEIDTKDNLKNDQIVEGMCDDILEMGENEEFGDDDGGLSQLKMETLSLKEKMKRKRKEIEENEKEKAFFLNKDEKVKARKSFSDSIIDYEKLRKSAPGGLVETEVKKKIMVV